MLGDLSEREMGWLSEMVIDRCRWFPSVAECRDLMGEQSYGNPFYGQRRARELDSLGYAPVSPILALEENKSSRLTLLIAD